MKNIIPKDFGSLTSALMPVVNFLTSIVINALIAIPITIVVWVILLFTFTGIAILPLSLIAGKDPFNIVMLIMINEITFRAMYVIIFILMMKYNYTTLAKAGKLLGDFLGYLEKSA